jgi:hypothetical protein
MFFPFLDGQLPLGEMEKSSHLLPLRTHPQEKSNMKRKKGTT